MGFTSLEVVPWLPFADLSTSVADQINDPDSTLTLYRALLALRRKTPCLVSGGMTMLDDNADNVLSYSRNLAGSTVYVAINFTDTPQSYTFPSDVTQLLGTHRDRHGSFRAIDLAPNEAVVAS